MHMNIRSLFLNHLAQTSPSPLALDIASAKGNYLYDNDGNKYLDLIGGISVCNTGHGHPNVVAAVQQQAEKYMHIMVYGELIQSPQVAYAQQIANHLPDNLESVYFTNSGTEATEGALKLAKRVTGKTDIIACNNSYHGSTMGALSVIGDEYWRNAYRPLLPGVWHYDYNSQELIDDISNDTACVLIETVQAEAGVIEPERKWLEQLRAKCSETCTILIFDEIQCGFGRTGKLWGFQHYGVIPDIILLGKALGGGMPLGAFTASQKMMNSFTNDPVLGHITTFGGHPVSCAAGKAAMDVLLQEQLIDSVAEKELLFRQNLKHPEIVKVNSKGLLIAVQLKSAEFVLDVVQNCIKNGLFTDWFLFAQDCLRIAPPLTITNDEIVYACDILRQSIDEAAK